MVVREILEMWDRRETALLLSHYMMKSPAYLYAHPEEPVMRKVEELVRRAVAYREEGYPLQYILGTWGFYSLDLKVREGVLIPRPETELLVDAAIALVKKRELAQPRIIDIGFGTGAIALAVKMHLPHAVVMGTDISRRALLLAEENKRALGLDEVTFLEGDLFAPVPNERFDIVLSNPPYLAEPERRGLQKELQYEPELALFAGAEGLDVYERLIPQAYEHLAEGGHLVLEIGANQAQLVKNLLVEHGFANVFTEPDLAGKDRMLVARKER